MRRSGFEVPSPAGPSSPGATGKGTTPTDRWRRARDIFEAALELAGTEQHRFLDLHCSDDATLRQEVENLVEADRSAEDWSGPAQAVSELLGAAMGDPQIGQLVGPYQLIERIGAGGMGIVFRAERSDGEYRHRVAIKLLPGLADEQTIRRFRLERQVLASLEHPLIARLYDGGLAGGRPYLVMEYVDGEPITRYCDRHRLGVRDRIELVRRLTEALRHAHSRLVVHRDIKPSNVFVDLEGTPRILDFGIAKVLGSGGGPTAIQAQESDVITRPDVSVMTPTYASPEQLRGWAVGTASDVYSLGLLLFELTTGHHPFRGRTRPPMDAPPPTPLEILDRDTTLEGSIEAIARTRGTHPRGLRRQLSGDLGLILAKALASDPAQRYTTMDALGADLRRWLDDLPIRARRSTLLYRGHKLVQRHRFAALGLGLALLSLLALTTSLWFQGQQLTRQRDLARLEKGRADTATTWLSDLFRLAQPAARDGRPFTSGELLRRGADRARSELGANPDTRSRVLASIADAYRNLGQLDEATELATEALQLRRPRPWPVDLDRASPEQLSRVVAWAESLHQASVLERLRGRFHVAERSSRHALDLQRRILGEEHEAIAASLDALAEALHELGHYDEADPLYRRALDLRRRLFGEEHYLVAESLDHLALLEVNRGRAGEALDLYQQALQIRQRILSDNHPDLARSFHRLGSAEIAEGNLDLAEKHLQQALEVFGRVYGERHPEFATCLHDIGYLQAKDGRLTEAAASFALSLELRRRIYRQPHPELVQSLGMSAAVSIRSGQLDEAEAWLDEALALAHQLFGEYHPYVARTLAHRVTLLQARGRNEEALLEQTRVVRILEEVLPPEHPELCHALLTWGHLLGQAADGPIGTPIERAVRCCEAALGPDHALTIRARGLMPR